jgi:purine-binding chemotaxis protein CheW
MENNIQESQFIIFYLSKNQFAMSTDNTKGLLHHQKISPVPLAPNEIIGVFNLRGRIVTVCDLRVMLGMDKTTNPENSMILIVEYENHLYGLAIDRVQNVIDYNQKILPTPGNLSEEVEKTALGMLDIDGIVTIILDKTKLLTKFSLTKEKAI